MAKRQKTQADYRRTFTNHDQFGRAWTVVIEKETGDPTGLISPCFTDPLSTPQQYIQVPTENRGHIHIDFQTWVEDLKAAWKLYFERRDRVGRAMYGDAYDPEKPQSAVMREAGEAPQDPRVVARAARGDRRLLGLEPETQTAANYDHVEDDTEPALTGPRFSLPPEE